MTSATLPVGLSPQQQAQLREINAQDAVKKFNQRATAERLSLGLLTRPEVCLLNAINVCGPANALFIREHLNRGPGGHEEHGRREVMSIVHANLRRLHKAGLIKRHYHGDSRQQVLDFFFGIEDYETAAWGLTKLAQKLLAEREIPTEALLLDP